MEKPCKIIGHIRGFLNINIEEFKASVENSLKNKNKIKSSILSTLDTEKGEEFLEKLSLAEKAYLARDDHHYYFERMIKSYLRLPLLEVEKILLRNEQIQYKEDIYFLTINEIKEALLGSSDFKNIISERKELFNYQKKLLAPLTIGKELPSTTDCIDENYILVVPFTRCGELEPIVNHVKGIISF